MSRKNFIVDYDTGSLSVTDSLDSVYNPIPGPSFNDRSCKMKEVIHEMRVGKAAGSFGIIDEMLKASSDVGVRIYSGLMNTKVKEATVLDDWLKGVIMNVILCNIQNTFSLPRKVFITTEKKKIPRTKYNTSELMMPSVYKEANCPVDHTVTLVQPHIKAPAFSVCY